MSMLQIATIVCPECHGAKTVLSKSDDAWDSEDCPMCHATGVFPPAPEGQLTRRIADLSAVVVDLKADVAMLTAENQRLLKEVGRLSMAQLDAVSVDELEEASRRQGKEIEDMQALNMAMLKRNSALADEVLERIAEAQEARQRANDLAWALRAGKRRASDAEGDGPNYAVWDTSEDEPQDSDIFQGRS